MTGERPDLSLVPDLTTIQIPDGDNSGHVLTGGWPPNNPEDVSVASNGKGVGPELVPAPPVEMITVQYEPDENNVARVVLEMSRRGATMPRNHLTDGPNRRMILHTLTGQRFDVQGNRIIKLGAKRNQDDYKDSTPELWDLEPGETLQLPTIGKPLLREDGREPFMDMDDEIIGAEILYTTVSDNYESLEMVFIDEERLEPDPFRRDDALVRRWERELSKLAQLPERQRKRRQRILAIGAATLALGLGGGSQELNNSAGSTRAAVPSPSGQLGHSYKTMETKIHVPVVGGTWAPAEQEVVEGVKILYPQGGISEQQIDYAAAMNAIVIERASGIRSEYQAERLQKDTILTVPDLPLKTRLQKWLDRAGKVFSLSSKN